MRSLRRYLLLIVGLSLLACVVAVVSLQLQRNLTTEEQLRRGARDAEELVAALGVWWSRDPHVPLVARGEGSDADRFAVNAELSRLLAGVTDGSAGFCTQDGHLTLSRTVGVDLALGDDGPPLPPDDDHRPPGPPPGPPPDLMPPDLGGPSPLPPDLGGPNGLPSLPPLPPDGFPHLLELDRSAVQSACYAEKPGVVQNTRADLPRSVLFISVKGLAGTEAAWSLMRVVKPHARSGLLVPLVVAGLFVLALVALTADALTVLNRGASQLERSLQALEQDLAAPVERPRALELARIAERIEAMARKLLVAHRRERSLEHQLGMQQRLAGLGRVVAGVAHEVRNPLTVLKLRLENMARRRLDDRSHADVETCLGEIARLDRVVGSLLVVARKAPPSVQGSGFEPLDLAWLVDARLQAADAIAGPRGVTLRRQGEARAATSSDDLTRVLDNLVRNAVDASPEGGEVVVSLGESGDEQVHVTVVDRGPGVPEARAGELFEPFFTLKPEGTGLGLFVSRSLVEAHGGTLAYERTGNATRFTVLLPRNHPNAESPSPSHRG